MASSSNANTVEGEGVTVVNKQAGVPWLREVIQNLKRQNKQVKIIFMLSVMNILCYNYLICMQYQNELCFFKTKIFKKSLTPFSPYCCGNKEN